jgi:hypothetical protein
VHLRTGVKYSTKVKNNDDDDNDWLMKSYHKTAVLWIRGNNKAMHDGNIDE